MNTTRASVWSFLLTTASLVGQDAPPAPGAGSVAKPAPRVTVAWRDGRTASVQVLAREGDHVRLRSELFDGHVVFGAALDEFTPESRYRLLLGHSPPQTFDEHLGVARQAHDWQLVEPTAHHLREALAAATGEDAESKRTAVRTWAVDWIESIVREAVSAGDVNEAERRLEMLCSRLAEGCEEDRLERLAQDVGAARAAKEAARAEARQQRLAERERAEIARRMQPIQRRIETGDARMREALRNSRRTVQTTRLAEQALEQWRAAWDGAQQLQRSFPTDAALAQELAALGETLRERSVRAALHVANALTIQSDFRSAITWVDRATEIDPDNADARELRRTIQFASAAAGGWGWGWGPTRN